MTLGDSICWSFARSVLIAGAALWPVAVLLRQSASCRTLWSRRVWLLLAVFPFFIPELLIGFNYRLTATQLSAGASPVVAAVCTESLYALLQLGRCVAVGVAISLLLPRSEVTRESLHSWNLLRSMPALSSFDWHRGWWRLRLIGPWQPMLIGWSVMALVTFQEFETAALMQIDRHPVAWSVWLFDAHAANQPLTVSLRMVAVPLVCEFLLLAPALFLFVWSQGLSSGTAELVTEDIPALTRSRENRGSLAVLLLVPAAFLFLLWPTFMNSVSAVKGLLLTLRGPLLKQSAQEILTSTAFAAASTFIAMSVAVRACRSRAGFSAIGRTKTILVAGAVVLPGLVGSLVLSLCLLAAFQTPPLRLFYDTWLPMLTGQSLAVLPRALAVVLLLQNTGDVAAIHSARMLLMSSVSDRRRFASAILWRLTTGRWLLGGLVVAHWCFWDVTVASILRPVQFEPVVTRLYNEMHYGRTEALMSLAALSTLVPLVVAGCVLAVSRVIHTRLGIPSQRKK